MKIQLRGGKTAPRLLQDLTLYDPRRLPSSAYNILTDLPLQYGEGRTPPARVAQGSCQHWWAVKDEQSTVPDNWDEKDPLSTYLVAAYCTRCRSHLELSIDFKGEGDNLVPCPDQDRPLHHFLHLPQLSTPRQEARTGSNARLGSDWIDTQRFQCTSTRCLAKLSIQIKPCRLTPDWVDLLTSTQVIKGRAEKAMAEEPARFEGHASPSPTEVLGNLRAYITNAMQDGEGRKILGKNKKWLLCLGEPCAELLLYLGFSRKDEDWISPSPEPSADVPFTNPLNILLNDVEKELLVLLSQRPDDERRGGKIAYSPAPAMKEFEAALGSAEYRKTLSPRTTDLTLEEHPCYASLGVTGDFHDELIIFAYHRQIESDPDGTPYYLECLQVLGEGRKSEELQTQAAIEASSDKISLKDIRGAYKDLGFDLHTDTLDEDTIIGTFQSRVSDSPRQEPELRRALKIIGQSRYSDRIQFVASKVVTNYEQALLWLGATEDMDDSFLVSMYLVKVSENQSDATTALHALSLIAEYRKSNALKGWIETGELGQVEMDVGQAYNRLGVSDRTIDDDTILAAYDCLVAEQPSQLDDLKRALTAIAKSKESQLLFSFLNSGMISSEHPLSEWPVGLENIGNTCYLNSLLQFYFTVEPLRDLVLDFDRYKMPIDSESRVDKRVGSRNVSKKEIHRAQRFVYELQRLFRNMITAPKAQVMPAQELARLTLISSTNEETIRRKSVLSAHRPSISLGDINGTAVLGPLPQSDPLPEKSDIEMVGNTSLETSTINMIDDKPDEDGSSEATLIDIPPDGDKDITMTDADRNDAKAQQQQILDDKENLPPSKGISLQPLTPENHLTPLAECSPSRTNEQPRPLSPIREINHNAEDDVVTMSPHPPNRPPPFPPRPKLEEQKNAIQEEISIGAQQDVTEVIANVLFQLQCAIKAESVDESGEQLDQIKQLFFGKQKSYTTDVTGTIRTKEEFISDIKVDVASGPRDIYAALDGAFDVQEVEVGGTLEPQYTTISQLPPILQILVQRAQFDPEKKSTFKSNHHLDLKEIIYMDRYMDSADPELMQRRQESWSWKTRRSILEKRRLELTTTDLEAGVPELLTSTATYIEQLAAAANSTNHITAVATDPDPIEVPATLVKNVAKAGNIAKEEIESIDSEIRKLTTNIASQFNDLRNIPYRLQSVFIHRGSVDAGHYWIYIYDFRQKIWRKYNDGYVTEIKDTTEIFVQESTNRPATSYFLVYVKDDLKEKLVNPICREISNTPGDPEDTVMEDAVVGAPIALSSKTETGADGWNPTNPEGYW